MSKKSENHVIAGLDVGTSKIVVMIGEVLPEGGLSVVGVGSRPSSGLKKGSVVHIESTVQSIQKAVEEAEWAAGCSIRTVYVGISGSHVRSLNSHGIVAVQGREVTQADVERVMEAAKAVPIPADQKILHVLPQQFSVDGEGGIQDPIGMSAVRLEAKVHMVTGSVVAAQNLTKCVRRCGLEVEDIILEQLASSYSVLTEDEKTLGVCLVDIGGGTTDIAVFTEGAIRHTAVIPIAGDQVTNDIAIALRTPMHYAEKLKLQYGCALKRLSDQGTLISVVDFSDKPGRQLSQALLTEVVEPRYEELFRLVKDELIRCGLESRIGSGIVLTGGSAQMPGAIELAEVVFEMPVRLGVTSYLNGLSSACQGPVYATAIGLLLYGYQHYRERQTVLSHDLPMVRAWHRLKRWVQGNF